MTTDPNEDVHAIFHIKSTSKSSWMDIYEKLHYRGWDPTKVKDVLKDIENIRVQDVLKEIKKLKWHEFKKGEPFFSHQYVKIKNPSQEDMKLWGITE